jgi:hypothetical protein
VPFTSAEDDEEAPGKGWVRAACAPGVVRWNDELSSSLRSERAHSNRSCLVADMVADGAKSGELRDDVIPDELATYCLHAATAATILTSKAAVKSLIDVTLSGLRPSKSVRHGS